MIQVKLLQVIEFSSKCDILFLGASWLKYFEMKKTD